MRPSGRARIGSWAVSKLRGIGRFNGQDLHTRAQDRGDHRYFRLGAAGQADRHRRCRNKRRYHQGGAVRLHPRHHQLQADREARAGIRRRIEFSPGRNPGGARRHAPPRGLRCRLGAHLLEQTGRHSQLARRGRGGRTRPQPSGTMARPPRRGQSLSDGAASPHGRPMPQRILLDRSLSWRQTAQVAEGAPLDLSDGALRRIEAARVLVESIVRQGVRAYGVNTGVGALCDTVVSESKQAELSRNIVMSHAVGLGSPLEAPQVRAIMAAAVNNFAHGYSGVRPAVAEALLELLNGGCVPEVPAAGAGGDLTHMAHIALVLIGAGWARSGGRRLSGAEALVLQAKEGLSLVNGTPCATGLSALALLRIERLLDWADVVAAMTFENLHGQVAVFDADALGLRVSAGVALVGQRLRALLRGSAILRQSAGRRTQ